MDFICPEHFSLKSVRSAAAKPGEPLHELETGFPFIDDVFTDKKGRLSEAGSNGRHCRLDTLRYSR
jgi:hypothetical protein